MTSLPGSMGPPPFPHGSNGSANPFTQQPHSGSHSHSSSFSSSPLVPNGLGLGSNGTAVNTTKILLLSDFSPELKTRDISLLFGEWEDDRGGFKIKWVDDVSCWIVFNDAAVAKRAYLSLLSSRPPALQPNADRTPKLRPYTGPDVASIITAVQSRPRSRSIASGGHSRKGSLLGSGGAGVGQNGSVGHARKLSSQGSGSGGGLLGGAEGNPPQRSWNTSGGGDTSGNVAGTGESVSKSPDQLSNGDAPVVAGASGNAGEGSGSGSPPVLGDAAKRHIQGALGRSSPAESHRKTDSRTGPDVANSLQSLTIDE